MECAISIENDSVLVKPGEKFPLRLDISKRYCQLYENTRSQARDYVEEVIKWCGQQPANFDAIVKNLLLHTAARRKKFGMKQ